MNVRGYFCAGNNFTREAFDINNPVPVEGLYIGRYADDGGPFLPEDVYECEFSANKIFDLSFDPLYATESNVLRNLGMIDDNANSEYEEEKFKDTIKNASWGHEYRSVDFSSYAGEILKAGYDCVRWRDKYDTSQFEFKISPSAKFRVIRKIEENGSAPIYDLNKTHKKLRVYVSEVDLGDSIIDAHRIHISGGGLKFSLNVEDLSTDYDILVLDVYYDSITLEYISEDDFVVFVRYLEWSKSGALAPKNRINISSGIKTYLYDGSHKSLLDRDFIRHYISVRTGKNDGTLDSNYEIRVFSDEIADYGRSPYAVTIYPKRVFDLCLGPELYSIENVKKLIHFIKRDDVGRNLKYENERGNAPVTFGDIIDKYEAGEHKYWWQFAQQIADSFYYKFFENGFDCVICSDYAGDEHNNLHGNLIYYINEKVEIEVYRNFFPSELEEKILFLDLAQISKVTGIEIESLVNFKNGSLLKKLQYDKISRALRSAGLLPLCSL